MKYYLKFLILSVFSLIFFSSLVSAHSYISPGKYETKFVPNKEMVLEYWMGGTGKQAYSINPGLVEYEILEEKVTDEKIYLKIKVKFPDYIETPGRRSIFSVAAEQVLAEGVGVGSKTKVIAPLYVTVPYEGIYLINKLSFPNINVNESLNIKVTSQNLGDTAAQNVNVKAEILRDGGLIAEMDLGTKDVLPDQTVTFSKRWDSTGYSPGDYKVKAYVTYAQNKEILEGDLKIGHLSVDVINYTDVFISQKVNEFDICVQNNWNTLIENVYANLRIENQDFKTISSKLDALGESCLTGFANIPYPAGTYKVDIDVYYTGQVTKKEGVITVINETSSFELSTILIILLIIILLLNILFFVVKHENEKSKEKRKKSKK
ncbi:hypothetical protein KY334_07815, partial [Candidatus Woesearchaeota archaeon]|nr:hypothetical protein [Candidatus Woesearchaeota archaeon]